MYALAILAIVSSLFLSESRQTKTQTDNAEGYAASSANTGNQILLVINLLTSNKTESGTPNKENNNSTQGPRFFHLTIAEWVQDSIALALAIITGLYVGFTARMAGQIKTQAGIMQKQIDNAQEQLCVSKNSIHALHQQIGQMRIANEQTNKLIEHSRANAEAAQDSARAAKESADSLIKSERAWIQVPEILLVQKLSFVTPAANQPFIYMHPYVVNNGRTNATITRIIAKADILDKDEYAQWGRPPILSEEPHFASIDTLIERNIILSPKEGIKWISVQITPEDLDSIKKGDAWLYVYGRIDYRDFSDQGRHTGFCKLYWIPTGTGGPVYVEDFVDAQIIPPKYTECT